jgi:hypothetical protein
MCRHLIEESNRVVILGCHIALSSGLSVICLHVVARNASPKCTGGLRIALPALRRLERSCVEPHERHV